MSKKAILTIALALAALLSSCANKTPPSICPTLPPAYIAHLDKTGFSGNTYGDITQYSVILKRERDVCLSRLDKIREWQVESVQH
ncbi:Rz1-like lysis system protein LysC [Aggregatibacter kilianii]|uniref:Rz1-like lysis system protein LysC n=1 Tax=Aggregatibacter kilianii TaxID=2025884 RepID=UPI003D1EBC96